MDEIGDLGKVPGIAKDGTYNPSLIFGYGCTVARDTEYIEDIARDSRIEYEMKELKARKLRHNDKVKLAQRLVSGDADFYGIFRNKAESTSGPWMERSGTENLMTSMLDASDQLLMVIDSDDVMFIIDDHTGYHKPEIERGIKEGFDELESRHGVDIDYEFGNSSSGVHKNRLQGNDLIPHSLLLDNEYDDSSIKDILGVKYKGLKNARLRRFPPSRPRLPHACARDDSQPH